MTEIMTEISIMKELLKDMGPIPVSLEMHPMMYRDLCALFRRDILIGNCALTPLSIYGLRLLTSLKLKHWACLVRDKNGKVIQVLRLTK